MGFFYVYIGELIILQTALKHETTYTCYVFDYKKETFTYSYLHVYGKYQEILDGHRPQEAMDGWPSYRPKFPMNLDPIYKFQLHTVLNKIWSSPSMHHAQIFPKLKKIYNIKSGMYGDSWWIQTCT